MGTDLLVLTVAGQVPKSKLEQSVKELAPQLRESALARRLKGSLNPFCTSWASQVNPQALLADATVRAAQLRELYRLETGAKPGVATADHLRDSLVAAGVDLNRARDSLQELSWTPARSRHDRERDWSLIQGRERQDSLQRMGGVMLGVVGAALGVGVVTWIAQQT